MNTRGFDIARQERREEEEEMKTPVRVTVIKTNGAFEFLLHGVGSAYGQSYTIHGGTVTATLTVYNGTSRIATIYNVEIVN